MELTRAPEYCSFKACKISRKGGFKQVAALPRKLLRDLNSTSAFNSPHHIYGVTGLWGDRKLHTMNLFFLLNNLLKFWIVKNAAPQAPGCYLIQAQHPLQTFKVNLRLEKKSQEKGVLVCDQNCECLYCGQNKLTNAHLYIWKTH